jgi:hypothetical protein
MPHRVVHQLAKVSRVVPSSDAVDVLACVIPHPIVAMAGLMPAFDTVAAPLYVGIQKCLIGGPEIEVLSDEERMGPSSPNDYLTQPGSLHRREIHDSDRAEVAFDHLDFSPEDVRAIAFLVSLLTAEIRGLHTVNDELLLGSGVHQVCSLFRCAGKVAHV